MLHCQQRPTQHLDFLYPILPFGFAVGVTAERCPDCYHLFSMTDSSAVTTVAIASSVSVCSVMLSATQIPWPIYLTRLMAVLVHLIGCPNSNACPFLDSTSLPISASSVHEASVAAQGVGAPPSDSLEFAIQFVAVAIVFVPGIGIVDSLLEE